MRVLKIVLSAGWKRPGRQLDLLALLLLTLLSGFASNSFAVILQSEPVEGADSREVAGGEVSSEDTSGNDSAARLFINRCSGCHTIGGGPLAGPDLLKSTDWPEADLAQATRRMQKNVGPLTEEQIQSLVDFMKSPQVQARLEEQRQAMEQQTLAAQEEEGSAPTGRRLFFGEKNLANGGTPCMACHQVAGQGGTLAKDLTGVAERMGRMPLLSGIRQSGFPVMKAAYAERPVTEQEALHLTTYLESAREGQVRAEEDISEMYIFTGVAALLFLLSLSYFYRNRNLGVRRQLVRNGSRRGAA